jgi:hypothetical protein
VAIWNDRFVRLDLWSEGLQVTWDYGKNNTPWGNGIPNFTNTVSNGNACESWGSALTGQTQVILGFQTVEIKRTSNKDGAVDSSMLGLPPTSIASPFSQLR